LSSIASSALMTVGLGGVVKWSLGVGRVFMCARRRMALFGIVLVSTIVWPGKVNTCISPNGGTAEDGDGLF